MPVSFKTQPSKSKKSPFVATFKNPSPELVSSLERLGKEIVSDMKSEIRSIGGSTRGRSKKQLENSKGYFAKRVKYRVLSRPKRWTALYITMWGGANGGTTKFADTHNLNARVMGKRVRGVVR